MANRISMKPEKPPYGHPVCNGCGRCCQEELCPLASFVFLQIEGPCPALEDVGDRFSCGLVNHPERYAPFRSAAMGRNALSRAATLMIGVGVGCDGQLESEEGSNPEYRARLDCDACPEVYEPATLGRGSAQREWSEMWAYARAAGWRARKVGEDWKHFCPDCK